MKHAEIDKYNQSPFLTMKVAYMYYMKNQSQSEIANELNVSVTTVSRLLNKAKEEKIIEFVIRDPFIRCIDAEEQIREFFNLQDVVIAPNGIEETIDDSEIAEENAKKLVALEGARYLQRTIRENDILGVTWGTTVYQMINYLNPSQKVNATFVTLHGSIANCADELDVRTLVQRMAKAFYGENYYLLTEALMSSKEAVKIICNERNNRKVFDMFDHVTVSVNGIGSFYPIESSVLAGEDFMSANDLNALRKADVVGDIALRFLNKDGEECETDLKDRMISISFEKFKRIPKKITLASGNGKAEAIISALKGGLIDVLIIDYQLAVTIMEKAGMNKV